jgi:predicted membrane protein
MARDWNDYEAKIREEIERKVAQAQEHAGRKAERMRQRAERGAERAKERAEWYAEKVKERAEREAERATEGYHKATRSAAPWANRVYPFGIRLNSCDGAGKGRHDSEILVGLAILGFGAALLLANLGIFETHDVFSFWPLILIAAGIMKLSRARFASARGFALFLIVAGVLMLLGNFHVVRVSWNLFWPGVLIMVGLQHLLSNFDPPKAEREQAAQPPPPPTGGTPNPYATAGVPPPPSSSPKYGPETPTSGPRAADDPGPRFAGAASAPPPFTPPPPPPPPGPAAGSMEPDVHLHEYCIFTGGKRRIVTNNFRGGEVVAVFGGVDVDLRSSQIGGDEAVVDITAAFGGCNIKVPMNWYVEMRGVAAFGGYSNKTIPPRMSPGQRIQKLVVTGSAAFGGVVIEN